MEKIMGPVGRFLSGLLSIAGKIWWMFPLLVVGVSYAVPDLRAVVSTGAPPERLFMWLFAQVILCGVWLVAAFFHVSSSNTTVGALKGDSFVSTTLAIFLTAGTVWCLAKGYLQWALIIPTVTAILDAYITGDRAINNAAQKPIVQQQNVRG